MGEVVFNDQTSLLDGRRNEHSKSETFKNKDPSVVLPYPKSIFFIIGNEFCERFSFYGMRAILTLYLHNVLLYSEDYSTVLFHSWTMLCYFTPILGAMVADSYWGRYKTILYISIIYLVGNSVLSFSTIPTVFSSLSSQKVGAFFGLFLIAVGTGGIKPCVSAFGGDQFQLPVQEKQLSQFFSVFYFTINAGSLLSTFVTPILREDVKCFNENCYSLAFGVPAILMFIAMFLFVGGSSMYIKYPPEGNMVITVIQCIFYSLKRKFVTGESRDHWLDYAKGRFPQQLILDLKDMFRVLFLFIPFPLFWALFDQQGSRWTFQATKMSGELNFMTIKPDQVQLLNPLMVLALIPVFEGVVYPRLNKSGFLNKPLQKMVCGGIFTAAAFFTSGLLELQLESSTEDSKVHMLWLIPQYVLMSIGEVMFSITGLEFSFTQAPVSMKSVIQASWLSTISMGNFIVVLIAHFNYFNRKSMEFFLFSLLMVLDMIIFIIMAMRYEYVQPQAESTRLQVINQQDDKSYLDQD